MKRAAQDEIWIQEIGVATEDVAICRETLKRLHGAGSFSSSTVAHGALGSSRACWASGPLQPAYAERDDDDDDDDDDDQFPGRDAGFHSTGMIVTKKH